MSRARSSGTSHDYDELMTWREFTGELPIFEMITGLVQFELVATTSSFAGSSDEPFQTEIGAAAYDHIIDVLRETGFFYEWELKVVRQADSVVVRYDDDRFDFQVAVGEQQIVIRKDRCALEDFHRWYGLFMPSAQGIIQAIQDSLSKASGRKVQILRVGFHFRVTLDQLKDQDGREVKNSDVMRRLLRRTPDLGGRIVEAETIEDPITLGRQDVTISRWVGPEPLRNEWFTIEAPGNREWSTLWFRFELRAEPYTRPDGVRTSFDPGRFLGEYLTAYQEFFRDKALVGFLGSVLDGYSFRSTLDL